MSNNIKKCFRNISSQDDFLTAVRNTSTDQGGKFKRLKLVMEEEENTIFVRTVEKSKAGLTKKDKDRLHNQDVALSDDELERLSYNLALFNVEYTIVECK